MSDVHYLWIFVLFFGLLGLLAPFINVETGSELDEEHADDVDQPTEESSGLTMLLNIATMMFWTFGLPAWVNVWILGLPRIVFIFLVARNIWVGGGS